MEHCQIIFNKLRKISIYLFRVWHHPNGSDGFQYKNYLVQQILFFKATTLKLDCLSWLFRLSSRARPGSKPFFNVLFGLTTVFAYY